MLVQQENNNPIVRVVFPFSGYGAASNQSINIDIVHLLRDGDSPLSIPDEVLKTRALTYIQQELNLDTGGRNLAHFEVRRPETGIIMINEKPVYGIVDPQNPKLLILDKDGTICRSRSGRQFINSFEDQELIPGVLDKIDEYRARGCQIGIVSNQGGVAFGYMSYDDAWDIMEHAQRLIGADYFHFCPEHPDGIVAEFTEESRYRKPNPGMLIEMAEDAEVDISEVLYVGDRPEDEQAAINAGVAFVWAKDFFGWEAGHV